MADTPAPLFGTAPDAALNVMSLNLRGPQDAPPHSWEERAPLVVDLVRRERPAVLGTQEGRWRHISLLDEALREDYGRVGEGRWGGRRSEFCAVYYDRSRLEATAHDTFWLSALPRVPGSRTWGNWQAPRIVTWVALRDRAAGNRFTVVNTHLDHKSARARRLGARAVAKLVLRRGGPVVATGDFNASEDSEAHRILTREAGLRDSWDAAARRASPQVRTWNGWGAPGPGERIDWILVSEGWTVEAAGVNTSCLLSDHWPVQALITPTP